MSGEHHADEVTGWVGWVMFAGVIMLVAGFFNAIEGLVALLRHSYYQVPSTGLVIKTSYATWGWALLISGVIVIAAGFGVMAGRTWARVLGVTLAVLNAVVNMGFVAAYPIWTTITIALDVLVIYALLAHGREARAIRG